jgi:hypothetical protein
MSVINNALMQVQIEPQGARLASGQNASLNANQANMQALVNQINQNGPSHHHLHYGPSNTVPAALRHN